MDKILGNIRGQIEEAVRIANDPAKKTRFIVLIEGIRKEARIERNRLANSRIIANRIRQEMGEAVHYKNSTAPERYLTGILLELAFDEIHVLKPEDLSARLLHHIHEDAYRTMIGL